MKKIGLFLGSFNPFHIGHREAIEKALNLGMDFVLIVPAVSNPWKKDKPKDISFRNLIVELETQDMENTKSIILMTPPREDGNYYSVDQLRMIKDMSKGDEEFYIIGGPEVVDTIRSWKEGDWILENFKTLGIDRPGFSEESSGTTISSTTIRDLIKDQNWEELKKYYRNPESVQQLKNSSYK